MPPSFVTHVRESNGAQVVSVRASGSSLSPGQIGKITDSTAGYVTCVLADSTDTGADEEKYVYILENISAGTNGEGIITGTITGVDTSTYTAPYVWLNASGTLSNTPSGGLVQLGKVNEAAGDGTIWFDGNPPKLDHVTPYDFGADPTGVADSTSALNAMSLFANALGIKSCDISGNTIYRITDTWVISPTDAEPCWFEGKSNVFGFQAYGMRTQIRWDAAPDASGSSATVGAPSSFISTVTGLAGMTANDVGKYLYFSALGSPLSTKEIRCFKIVAYNSATSVDIYNDSPTAVTGAVGAWEMIRKPAILAYGAGNRVEGIDVRCASASRVLFAGFEDRRKFGTGFISNNLWRHCSASTEQYVQGKIVFGAVHADLDAEPRPAGTDLNGENNVYERCTFDWLERAGYHSPNNTGQNYKTVFRECIIAHSPYCFSMQSGAYAAYSCDITHAYVQIIHSPDGGYNFYSMPILLENCISEASKRLFYATSGFGSYLNVTVIGGRYATDGLATDGVWVQMTGSGNLLMLGVAHTGYKANFKIRGYQAEAGPGNASATALTAIGTLFPNETPFDRTDSWRCTYTSIDCKGLTAVGNSANVFNLISEPWGSAKDFARENTVAWLNPVVQVATASVNPIKPSVQVLYNELSSPGAVTHYLPATPTDDCVITVVDSTGDAGTNTITVDGNGKTIRGTATITTNYGERQFRYVSSTDEWIAK